MIMDTSLVCIHFQQLGILIPIWDKKLHRFYEAKLKWIEAKSSQRGFVLFSLFPKGS